MTLRCTYRHVFGRVFDHVSWLVCYRAYWYAFRFVPPRVSACVYEAWA